MKKSVTVLILITFFLCNLTTISSRLNSNDITENIWVNGKNREFIVHLPNEESNLPLVINMHGMGGTPLQHQSTSQFDVVADREGFVVVYPAAEEPSRVWDYPEDIDFISAIIDMMIEHYEIDPYRVYSTGHSMGGFFSYYLAAELEDRIVAIGPVAGLMPFESGATRPWRGVPVLHIHNEQDIIVNYDYVPETIENWVNWNECPQIPETTVYNEDPEVIMDYYGPGLHNSEVVLFTLDDPSAAGHFWPHAEHGIESAEVIWEFFEKYDLSPTSSIAINKNYINSLELINGESIGAQLIAVKITIENIDENKFWDGQGWSSIQCWLNAQPLDESWGETTESWFYDTTEINFVDGDRFKVSAKAFDSYDREELESTSEAFLFDSIPPETEIIEAPTGTINSSVVSISWAGYDNHSSPCTFKYKLVGYDQDWSIWRILNEITFENLSDGDYTFYVKARDKAKNEEENPASISFTIKKDSDPNNNPPNSPTIAGETSGRMGDEYQYSFNSIDPDGDDIYYEVKWQESAEIISYGPYSSGEEVFQNHSWTTKDTHTIFVRARDILGAESDWTIFNVDIYKNKMVNIFLKRIFLQIPFVKSIFLLFNTKILN